jgi:hypothetical protein
MYVAKYAVASETLKLLPDGTFTQQIVLSSNHQVIATNGTWALGYEGGDMITFQNGYLIVLDGFGHERKPPLPGTAVLPVSFWFGKIHIGGDPTIEYKQL